MARRTNNMAPTEPAFTQDVLRQRAFEIAAMRRQTGMGLAGLGMQPSMANAPAAPATERRHGIIYRNKGLIAKMALGTTGLFFLATQADKDFNSLLQPGCQLMVKYTDQKVSTVRNDLFQHGVEDPGKMTYITPDHIKADYTGKNDGSIVAKGSSLVMTDVPNTACDAIASDFGVANHLSRLDDLKSIVLR